MVIYFKFDDIFFDFTAVVPIAPWGAKWTHRGDTGYFNFLRETQQFLMSFRHDGNYYLKVDHSLG